MASSAPVSATIRAYQVGFGDCFLLSFAYAKAPERHLLIDFGTTKLPEKAPADQMARIAADVAKRCGGKLAAVVATHRHQDHISGFATSAKAPGKVIADLAPGVVLQPWTEDPLLAPQAAGPKGPSIAEREAVARSFAAMQKVAGAARDAAEALHGHAPAEILDQLGFLGEDNLSNASAVKNLMTMGKKALYLSYGSRSGLGTALPGVTVSVLGPPSISQYPKVEAERARDAGEYWNLAGRTLGADAGTSGPLFRGSRPAADTLPMEARWFVPRVRSGFAEGLLELVRRMDDYMNNTSLILLFEVGGKALLFPGDAQIENWEYALFHAPAADRAALAKRLANVELYKVGHHGSLNATPKTMWGLLKKRGSAADPGRLASVMSTLPGKHGSVKNGTEVPRGTLEKALKAESALTATHRYKDTELYREVTIAF